MQIIVEGWRFIPHSYSIVNQFQCLELLQRSQIQLFHRDLPYYAQHWQPINGLFSATDEVALRRIPVPEPGQSADVMLRMGYPHDFSPSGAARSYLFGTTELGLVKQVAIAGGESLQTAHASSEIVIITSSHWSKTGYLNSGADPSRVVVVPLGVDPFLFHPLPPAEKVALRQAMGWDGFVFLNISGMGGNKGIQLLLKAFAVLAEQYPDVRLALKGLDGLYGSDRLLRDSTQLMTEAEIARVEERLLYIGDTLSFAEVAQLYQAADVYISPYLAEGFNLPALEAIACGLPIICTAGGATDDFTQPEFALRIDSQRQEIEAEPGKRGYILVPDIAHLLSLMQTVIEQPSFVAQAQELGARFVAEKFTWKHTVDRLLAVMAADLS